MPLTIQLICLRMLDELIKSALKESRLPFNALDRVDAYTLIEERESYEMIIYLSVRS